MKRIAILILPLVAFFACSPDRNGPVAHQRENDSSGTKDALIPEIDATDYLTSAGKGRGTLIDQLYQEALKRDEKLSELNERLNSLREVVGDSLEEFKTYQSYTSQYQQALSYCLTQLNDTTLREALKTFAKDMDDAQKTRTAGLVSTVDDVNNRRKMLDDYSILMKISVTAPMMTSYQIDELPKDDGLKQLLADFDQTTAEVKQQVNIH